MSVNRQTDKENDEHADKGMTFSLKKHENPARWDTTDSLEDIMVSEVSQSQNNKCCMIPFI